MLFRILKQYYKSIIVGLLILWLSLTGNSSLMPGHFLNIPYIDKIGHFAMYALFSALLLLDSCNWDRRVRFRFIILLIPLLFGALMEILQMELTSVRKAEIGDLIADIGGIAAGILTAYIFRFLAGRIRS